MRFPKRPLFFLLLTIFVVCTLLGTISYVQYLNSKRQYNDFLLAERKTISTFDALNEDVVENLPELPPGSALKKKWSVGIDAPQYEHGRWLFMEFSTTQQPSDILEYYRAFFTRDGWSENTSLRAFDHLFFFKGTSCVEIVPPSEKYAYYEIYVWHDYDSQTFSPRLPDKKTMSWFESGLTNIATCP